MRIIAIANQKGGCGKTTTAINLSASLAFLGKKTLLVDLDPQGHSTLGLGYHFNTFEKSLYDVLSPRETQVSLQDIILKSSETLHLVPSHVILSAIEQQLAGVYGREEKLLEKIRTVRGQYDFVIIDCPPNLGLLTFNALRAADELVIPVEPSFFSLQGLKKIRETVNLIQETLKHEIALHVVLTLFNSRSSFNQKIFFELKQMFGEQMLKTLIHQNVRLKEAAEAGKSICDFDRKSIGFRDYLNMATEMIERGFGWIPLSEPLEKAVAEEPQSLFVTSEERVQTSSSFEIPEDPIMSIESEINEKVCPKYPSLMEEGVILGYIDPRAKLVQVAGDFNNWVNEAMDYSFEEEGLWRKLIPLEAGRYRYKFIVDGEWQVDPLNEVSEPNPYGGIDSVILIAPLREEIFDERSSRV